MAEAAPFLSPCLNCGAELTGRHCSQCGQKAGPANPSARDLLHDLSHEFLHLDGKIVRSVRLLLTRPGALTSELFAGRRVPYVSPIRLYLIFSVAYFAVAAFAPAAGLRITITPSPGDSTEEVQRGTERLPVAQRAAEQALGQWIPRALFVLVPAFAALVALSVRKSGRNYPQHLYFALHVHAAWFFAAAVATAARIKTLPGITRGVPVLAALYAVAYLWMALRRVYGLSWAGSLVRAGTVWLVYGLLVLSVVLLIALPAARQAIGQP